MDDRVRELEAQVRSLQAALRDAAGTAVQALDRLLLMEPVVKAAADWSDMNSLYNCQRLRDSYITYFNKIAKRE